MPNVTYNGPDVASAAILTALGEVIDQYSSISARLTAAEGDRDKALQFWMENSDHEQAVKYRTAIQRAQEKLRELAENEVVSESLSDEDKTKLAAEQTELRKRVKDGREAVKMVAALNSDKENVLKVLEEMGDPTRSNRGRRPGTAGSTAPRVSATVYLRTEVMPEDKWEEYETFSLAAKRLNVETSDFSQAFADAAGVSYENIKSVDKVVEFNIKPPGSQLKWFVKTEPKERQKPGPKSQGAAA